MIGGIVILSLIVVIGSIYRYYREKSQDQQADDTVDTEAKDVFVYETRDLVLETLRKIGCEYVEAENMEIYFIYQGHRFMIKSSNECLYINVYDLWWYHLSKYCEVEDFAAMQKTVNRINANANCTVLYTINDEAEEIGVHSKKNMLFIRQIPELKGYLLGVLDDFFKVQREVITEIERSRIQEYEK